MSNEAWADLTGAPSYVYLLKDKTFDDIFKAIKEKWLVGAATDTNKNGLIYGHAYTILDAAQVTDNEEKECNIV